MRAGKVVGRVRAGKVVGRVRAGKVVGRVRAGKVVSRVCAGKVVGRMRTGKVGRSSGAAPGRGRSQRNRLGEYLLRAAEVVAGDEPGVGVVAEDSVRSV
ncbi:hypothetical protein DFR68_11481 [Nocardia mexicana]|uniref:Uncharacterized protein n=1 Tax=Nocardia mexicana TaxID=279262 RepID=A0A370GNV9_9NOCA|nr:hypothetical protein DFR68_11481 [Nocardia mexicana]